MPHNNTLGKYSSDSITAITQLEFTCLKSAMETCESNLCKRCKIENKDTRTTSIIDLNSK